MIVAQKLRKQNISAYIIYMFQVEDIIRAYGLDVDRICNEYLPRHISNYSRLQGRQVPAQDVRLDAGVAVVVRDHFIRYAGDLFLHFVELAAHEALHGEDGVLRVRHGLAFRGLADEAFAVLGESDDGRSRVGAFRVGDDLEGVAVHDGHAAVGGAEVNTENLAHSNCPFL